MTRNRAPSLLREYLREYDTEVLKKVPQIEGNAMLPIAKTISSIYRPCACWQTCSRSHPFDCPQQLIKARLRILFQQNLVLST